MALVEPISRRASGFVNALERHAAERPGHIALVFLGPDGAPLDELSWGDLRARARRFAAWLVQQPRPGDAVLLLIRPEAASVVALLGCFYAGVACAPAPTPGVNGSLRKLSAFATASGAGLVAAHGRIEPLRDAAPSLTWIDADAALPESPAGRSDALVQVPDDAVALVQFTSGSTSAPKGVELTHAHIVANLEMLRLAFGVDADSRFASWLPLFHDMGLAMLLMPLYFGVTGVLMPPLTFVRRPARWLRMVDAHRATITGAPNFAYELCLSRIDEAEAATLDLSSLHVAFCGAEPVRRSTMAAFAERFASQGLDPGAMYPCYGLAEAVTFVSGGRLFETAADVRAADSGSTAPCGRAAAGSSVVVVDPATSELVQEGGCGELWVSGPHVGRGYRDLPQESAEVFRARLGGCERLYLRTGDLGRLDAQGRLILVGRAKDVLIHRGENIHAADLEAAVAASHPGFGPAGAAFSTTVGDGEGAVVVQEAARGGGGDLRAMRAAALEAVAAEHGLRLHELVLVRPGALPKTTSGKVRRQEAQDLYLRGEIQNLFGTASAAGS